MMNLLLKYAFVDQIPLVKVQYEEISIIDEGELCSCL
jgi:hypothetical protein